MTLFEEHARFVDVRTIDTGTGVTITADQVVVAAGSRPDLPDIEGLDEVGFHTSDTVMRVDELPERLLILGGGYVAAEFAHVFGSFGSRVTIVNRSPGLLRSQDEEISERFTALAADRWDLRLAVVVEKVERYAGGIRAHLATAATVEADLLLVATGRRSNADGLDLDRTGVEVDDEGVVVVDEYQRTTVDGRLGARRHRQPLPAQARLQPRGPGRPAQPAAPRRPRRDVAPRTTRCPARCSPARRSPASASASGRPSRRASSTSSRTRTTAARRTAGRWRTPPASPSCWPTRSAG